jgi:hypothetical protein
VRVQVCKILFNFSQGGKMRVKSRIFILVVAGLLGLSVVGFLLGFHLTEAEPQMVGINGWEEYPIFTVDETIRGYTPPGILDGIAAFPLGSKGVKFLVNHELTNTQGYPYELANGALLPGARVTSFYVEKTTGCVVNAGLAYDTIYNRAGEMVTGPDDLEFGGLNRLCSSQGASKGTFSFMDDLYFTGEETGGGTEFVLDVKRRQLWAAPAMGRAAWENVTPLDTGDDSTVAILVGDDRGGAPLLLYIGQKESGNVLERNGLAKGNLYVWVADSGDLSPEEWNGTGTSRSGKFVEIDYYRPDLAGDGEYDELGYATQAKQDALAAEAGAFQFSRPEDVATNPYDGTVAVLASTGRDSLFPADSWGTIYTLTVDFSDLSCAIYVAYDGDDSGGGYFAHPDFGIRSPDNLDWARDGYVYVNEDRSIGEFGETSEIEASMWKLDPAFPDTNGIERIALMNRGAELPDDQTDPEPDDIGNWESSGVLDVSHLFGAEGGTLLIADVQAHSVRGGSIGGNSGLVQGGQLFFLYGGENPE